MTLDWSKVVPLAKPIQTSATDVVCSGHGAFTFKGETTVPAGVEFCVLAPPGASLADSAGQAIESGARITKVGLKNQGSDVLINNTPIIKTAGQQVPNYILQAPDGIIIKPGVAHLIVVGQDTTLEILWPRILAFAKPGVTLRCFWAACTVLDGATNPVVLVQ
jgi:hypothetical protein